MKVFTKLKEKCSSFVASCKSRVDAVKSRFNAAKAIAATALVVVSVPSMAADTVDIATIGTSAAVEIAKFAVMISAIGAAILSIVVLIQGFRVAWKMIRMGT